MDRRQHLAWSIGFFTCLLVGLVAAGTVRAETPAGITVVGVGESLVMPTRIEIPTAVSGQSEIAADAEVKYRNALKRLSTALDALHIEGLEVKSMGVGINNPANQAQMQMLMAGRPMPTTQPGLGVSERVNICIDHVDKLEPQKVVGLVARVVDTIKDTGLTVGAVDPTNIMEVQLMQRGGGNSLVQFKLALTPEARKPSFEKAMTEARVKAQVIASLAGVKLGPVISVSESDTATAENQSSAVLRSLYGIRTTTRSNEVTSPTFQPIAVSESLAVTFAIEK